jgi:hypothetical protein
MEWATIDNPCIAELSNNCTCVYCPTCAVSGYGIDLPSNCDDCKGELQPYFENCYGDCYDYAVEDIADNIFPEAMARLGNPTYLKIEGRAMGWQRLQGYAICQGTWESFYNKLRINGEYTLRFKLAGDSFTVIRSSHDEPTGAFFEVLASKEEGEDA